MSRVERVASASPSFTGWRKGSTWSTLSSSRVLEIGVLEIRVKVIKQFPPGQVKRQFGAAICLRAMGTGNHHVEFGSAWAAF